MKLFEDGKVSLTWQNSGGKVRILDHVPSGETPPFVGVGDILRVSERIAKLHGFHVEEGKFTVRHARLLCILLLEEGYDTLYVQRADGHVMPMAEAVEEGDFRGWWRLDLDHAARKLKLKPLAIEKSQR
jgi:hypothetical protein